MAVTACSLRSDRSELRPWAVDRRCPGKEAQGLALGWLLRPWAGHGKPTCTGALGLSARFSRGEIPSVVADVQSPPALLPWTPCAPELGWRLWATAPADVHTPSQAASCSRGSSRVRAGAGRAGVPSHLCSHQVGTSQAPKQLVSHLEASRTPGREESVSPAEPCTRTFLEGRPVLARVAALGWMGSSALELWLMWRRKCGLLLTFNEPKFALQRPVWLAAAVLAARPRAQLPRHRAELPRVARELSWVCPCATLGCSRLQPGASCAVLRRRAQGGHQP